MLSIKKIDDVALSDILSLSVHECQLPYVGTIESLINKGTKGSYFHVLVLDDEVVGLFIVETDYDKNYEFLLREDLHLAIFFIDKRFQGQGLGKKSCSLLYPYLRENFPDYDSIVLTVNCNNTGAYKCYISSGFNDTMQFYHGGPTGPQHIMRLRLRS